jgi:DNA-nicking Smr family endonuclease
MYIDLHGYTIHTAWKRYRDASRQCYFNETKRLTVVTGYGIMQNEFRTWVENDPYADNAKSLDPNKGAWHVSIKKPAIKKEKHPEPVDLTGLYKKYNR